MPTGVQVASSNFQSTLNNEELSESELLNEYLLILHENEGTLIEEESNITRFLLAMIFDMSNLYVLNGGPSRPLTEMEE